MNRKIVAICALVALAGGVTYYAMRDSSAQSTSATAGGQQGGRRGGGGQGGFGGFGGGFGGPGGFGGGPRLPMTVELAQVKRADMSTDITVVGNLIGAATVEALPKV